MKVAFENLRRREQNGFWVGLLFGIPLGVYVAGRPFYQAKYNLGGVGKGVVGLVVGSLVYILNNKLSYGAYVFTARHHYNDISARINRKYSVLINKTMNY